MSPALQTAIALTVVAIAAGSLIWRAMRRFFGGTSSGCGTGCGSCPTSAATNDKPVVQLSLSANREQSA
ncbi:hypothetical protein [Stratiformator vulcanicus]|uniref:Virus attachment protein p12 family protein n=1 Tax=Stratiformator vulcanicus TaxID=2527980 RepID=A0A517QVJ5_9PLAN|nr:hypothetical protein [Stratiformator vulcanicus]QDT35669.1 hypothetical protein Pan189_00220 [Stratiformator vulcanicus]